jgi:hypothetical protein
VHNAEVEARGFLHRIQHFRIILGAEARKLDFNTIGADLADDGLGNAEPSIRV